jgi:hypothetical protein
LYTKDEIQSGVKVREMAGDFPLEFALNKGKELEKIIGRSITDNFVNKIINDLIE